METASSSVAVTQISAALLGDAAEAAVYTGHFLLGVSHFCHSELVELAQLII